MIRTKNQPFLALQSSSLLLLQHLQYLVTKLGQLIGSINNECLVTQLSRQ